MTNNNINSSISQKEDSKQENNVDIEVVKISRLRKAIAKQMVISKTIIPEVTLIDEININKLVSLRKKMKIEAEKKGIKLTYISFIAKAVILALQEFPLLNSSFSDEKEEIIIKKNINLGIAVDTKQGLIVPNIKDVANLSVFSLAKQIQLIVQKTIDRKIELNDITKGTFTLSNYGSIGALYATPIINHPEVAILGIGKMLQKPVVENENISIGNVLPFSLTFDHRVIDGSYGVKFLNKINSLLCDTSVLEENIF
ncbi:dihydrolipoamide acetyltransferase family protein [Candidatus Phytoplasma palmae]|uniref:dihydrolipoamide acetyltransferase family protein n=1 Tax=Candidatus Phytoplasma palmae TaxID=85624 RepID=UPI003990ABBB